MFGHSQIAQFAAFLALLSPALATVYRLDDRSPQRVRQDGGLVSWNPAGTGSVIQHVRAELGRQDPWVSTTTDKKLLKKGATTPGEIYIYYIEESGLNLVDTKKAFRDARQEHPHPGEEEMSVKGRIPWKNIKKWDVYKRSKKQGEQTRKDFEGGRKDKKRSEPLDSEPLDSEPLDSEPSDSEPLVHSAKFRV